MDQAVKDVQAVLWGWPLFLREVWNVGTDRRKMGIIEVFSQGMT